MNINIVELATKLAEGDLLNHYTETEIFEMLQDNVLVYTKDAQEIFNGYYDFYMKLIQDCEQLN